MDIIDQLAQTREECLLHSLSEKDSQLALLEFKHAPSQQVKALKLERENLLIQVKQHSENRAKVNERQKKYIEKDLTLTQQAANFSKLHSSSSGESTEKPKAPIIPQITTTMGRDDRT